MNSTQILPKFIIAGAPRSGSTFLMENLITHPQIFMPTPVGAHSTGDIHFFDINRKEGAVNYEKGFDWYKELFLQAPENVVVGEKTADYLADPLACELIFKYLGRIKIIVSLRDPVSRANSHFWHERHNLSNLESLFDLLQIGKDYGDAWVLRSGFYGTHLSRYFEKFGRDNVYVVLQEDLKARPEFALREVCNFLGVDSDHDFPYANSRINRGTDSIVVQRLKRAANYLRETFPRLYEVVRNSRLGNGMLGYVGRLRATGNSRAKNANDENQGYPSLDQSEIAAARNFYRKEVSHASRLLNEDLGVKWWGERTL